MEYPKIDRYAFLSSPIHQFEPRAKILTFSALIFSFVLINDVRIAAFYLIFSLFILMISKLPLRFMFKHIKWVFLFVLPFLVVMPFTVEGSEILRINGLVITYEGLRYGILVTLRALSAVILVFVMLGTMKFDTTIKALHMLKVPSSLVQMLMFTYRYIFVFIDEFTSMWKAMNSKGFKLKTNLYSLSTTGKIVGMLIVKSYERAERVYNSMVAKGYTGNPMTMTKFKTGGKDYVLSISMIAVGILPHVYPLVL
jgi:cobalt/nickel transport system permease protein